VLWTAACMLRTRFGFGLASFTAEIDLARERSAFHASFAGWGRVQLVPPAAAELAAEIDADETRHRQRSVARLLHPRVRQVERFEPQKTGKITSQLQPRINS